MQTALRVFQAAEGGTRTRTAFWARGFSYHYGFRHLQGLQFVVWTMPSPCTIPNETLFRREPSRLYTLPKISVLARRCHIKGFTEFDSIHDRVSRRRAQII